MEASSVMGKEMPQACLGYPCNHPRLSFPHLSNRTLMSMIPEVPSLPQLALPLAPPSLGGEPHTTFDPPMINQVAHLGRPESLPPAPGDFIREIQ